MFTFRNSEVYKLSKRQKGKYKKEIFHACCTTNQTCKKNGAYNCQCDKRSHCDYFAVCIH